MRTRNTIRIEWKMVGSERRIFKSLMRFLYQNVALSKFIFTTFSTEGGGGRGERKDQN